MTRDDAGAIITSTGSRRLQTRSSESCATSAATSLQDGGDPDFENYNCGLTTGLVESTLSSDDKPIFAGPLLR